MSGPASSRGLLGAARGIALTTAVACGLAAAPAGARLPATAHHRHRSRQAIRSAAEGGCPIFPADNPLNQEVTSLPQSPNSQAYVESIGLTAHLHPDFGNNPGLRHPL